MFLLRWLVRGLIKLLGAVAQIAAFLLVKLGLWVPLFFAFGYLLVCAYFKIPLADPKALDVLTSGCIISAVAGIAGTAYFRERRRAADRREKENRKLVRTQKNKYEGSQKTVRPQKPAEQYSKFNEGEYGGSARENDNEYSGGAYNETTDVLSCGDDGDAQYEQKYLVRAERRSRDGGAPEPSHAQRQAVAPASFPEETPLVFATRKDPNIFIAEYSDRLIFYRKLKNGKSELIATEYKK